MCPAASGSKQSRDWRPGRGPGAGLFFAVFFAAGCVAAYGITTTLLQGDPGNHLQGRFPFKALWLLFPLPFLAVGSLGLWFTVRGWARRNQSPERQRAEGEPPAAPAAGVRETAGAVFSPAPRPDYPTVPAVTASQGEVLAARLAPAESPGCQIACAVIALLICSGVLTPVVNAVQGGWLKNQFAGLGSLLAGAVLALLVVGWLSLAFALVKQVRLALLGVPVVEVSALPLEPGRTYQVFFRGPGGAPVRGLRVALVCDEEAKYQQGTNTRTETRRVRTQDLCRADEGDRDGGPPAEGRWDFALPAGAMHSFQAKHNHVRWQVLVEGRLAFWGGFTYKYPVVVYPPRRYEAPA